MRRSFRILVRAALCLLLSTHSTWAADAGAPSLADAGSSVEVRARSDADAPRSLDASIGITSDASVDADAEPTDAAAEQPVDASVALQPVADAAADVSEGAADELAPPTVPETRPAPVPEERRSKLALQTILGLLALLALAYIGNHPLFRRIEDALGLRSAITAGFPFVALGLIARHPSVGILDDRVLLGVTPLVEFGLGWLGFLVGYRLDLREVDRLPKGAPLVLSLGALLPFACVAAASGLALVSMGFDWHEQLFVRSAVVLGTAAAMSAPLAVRTLVPATERVSIAQHLDELVGIVGLAVLAAYFRPPGLPAQWALPGTAWLFVTVGMGVVLGVVLYLMLRRPMTSPEFMAIALGSVAFAAGMAAYLGLSPLVICFVAGAVITNLPSLHRDALGKTLARLERPIFLIFLALAGALWDPRDWRGWALAAVFVVSRYAGLGLCRMLALRRAARAFVELRPRSLFVAPLSVVAIAVVVNVRILYRGPVVPLMITAVIGGALLAELISALAERRSAEPVDGE